MRPFEELTPRQQHTRTALLTTVASFLGICVILLPLVGYLLRPHAVKFVSEAVASDIAREVQAQIAPGNAGLKVLIQSNIVQLEDEIAALEYRKARNENFTATDVQSLVNKQRQLAAQKSALEAIVTAEQATRGR